MKKHIKSICIVILLFIGSFAGFYAWCSYNPTINITVSESSAGENLNIEAPHIVILEPFGIPTAASIELKITNLWIQHEYICKSIANSYISSDIELKINVVDNQTILIYSGTATTSENKTVNYYNEIPLDFVLDANIKHV